MNAIRCWLVRCLMAIVRWLDPPAPPPAPLDDPLDQMADALVAQAEMLVGKSDEFRRHWVYARLVKAFPSRPRRHAGMAIERAIAIRHDSIGA